jgi:hypothetical protein
MGRGRQSDGVDVPASEMKKWFVIHGVHHPDSFIVFIFQV